MVTINIRKSLIVLICKNSYIKQAWLVWLSQWIERQPACEPKGHRFDSQSGHRPGLQVRSPVGGV